ncbi:hypothetical protein PsYK624_026050 [Phanerochaete sordida]|uniref:F-box domain-containing protein n=1 Tax=Phanerochaete sordida TaxID=48140 RepID=A0A9P3G257_9APHY|nr:hypothetical protein PsYK624_026050 [Phanerochaete sordida]
MRHRTFPVLESVEVTMPESVAYMGYLSPLDFDCPRLTSLWLTSVRFNYNSPSIGTLRTLGLSYVQLTPSDLRRIARGAPQLDHLHIEGGIEVYDVNFDNGVGRDPLAHFPSLVSLVLEGLPGPQDALLYISAPTLTSLTISASTLFSISDWIAPRPPRPLLPLQTLHLAEVKVDSADGEGGPALYHGRLFEWVPQATTLVLSKCDARAAPLLEYLATAVPVALSALDVLVVRGRETVHQDVLLRIVRHYAQNGHPIQEVKFGRKLREELDGLFVSDLEEYVRVTVDDVDE